MKNTKKLTTDIPIDLDKKLTAYCTRKGVSKRQATERAISNLMTADEYMLFVARIGIKSNAA